MTINGGCSGALLNRFWVLTAHHCVAVGGALGGPLLAPEQVTVTAEWSPRNVVPTRIVSYAGVGAGATFQSDIGGVQPDIALLFLGGGDFGAVNTQLIFHHEVTDELTITQYGRGLMSLASGAFPTPMNPAPASAATAGTPSATYRSGRFTPQPETREASGFMPAATIGYRWDNANSANPSSPIGHGGDSGGPSFVTSPDGVAIGIAGVQSTCAGTYIPGAPPPPPPGAAAPTGVQWQWIGSIDSCFYPAIFPLRDSVITTIEEGRRPCRDVEAACGAVPIAAHLMLLP